MMGATRTRAGWLWICGQAFSSRDRNLWEVGSSTNSSFGEKGRQLGAGVHAHVDSQVVRILPHIWPYRGQAFYVYDWLEGHVYWHAYRFFKWAPPRNNCEAESPVGGSRTGPRRVRCQPGLVLAGKRARAERL